MANAGDLPVELDHDKDGNHSDRPRTVRSVENMEIVGTTIKQYVFII